MTDLPKMDHEEVVKVRLTALSAVHRELDEQIKALEEDGCSDMLLLRRLKKRKLGLKDQIARLEDELNPDIIA
ncbi:YdcH family protein [Halovulum sp. GXIMD14793]